MSNKIFETDSDLEVEPEESEPVEVSEPAPTAPKVKAKTKAKTKVLASEAVEDDVTEAAEAADQLGEPKKQRKKRAPLTEERKAQLLANLEKGRLKALENRKKKAQVKKIIKKKKEEDMDTLIQEDLVAKKTQASEKNKLREDLDEMKLMMKNLMEENSKLRSSKAPSSAQQPSSAKAEPTLQTIKEESAPVIPVRPKYISKGIRSRWDKYKL